MGVKETGNNMKGKAQKNRAHSESDDDSDEQSNQTMPIPAMEQLSINERANSGQTVAPPQINNQDPFGFLKNKAIKKRNRKYDSSSSENMRKRIQKMSKRIQDLERELAQVRKQEDSCPHCHFYLNQPVKNQRESMTPEENNIFQTFKRSTSKDSLQFEKIDFNMPLMYSPQMQEKSWIFLGTIMIAMGSKVMDMDGTMNVFKILKESVDRMRRQVQKSEEKLSMDFFLGKQQIENEIGMNELDFDPFYHKEQHRGGLQLQGVRVQSVQQYDLYFDQKLSFNVKYDALITIMQYMKQNCSISYN